jgi:hypothetical protein
MAPRPTRATTSAGVPSLAAVGSRKGVATLGKTNRYSVLLLTICFSVFVSVETAPQDCRSMSHLAVCRVETHEPLHDLPWQGPEAGYVTLSPSVTSGAPSLPAIPSPTPFTLEKLAQALRGMARDALMLVRMPDGALRHIDMLKPEHVAGREGDPEVVREPSASSNISTSIEIVELEQALAHALRFRSRH